MSLALWVLVLANGGFAQPDVHVVKDVAALRSAIGKAKPGTEILLEPGHYQGGLQFTDLHGSAEKPIVIGARDPQKPPRIIGGGSGLQLSDVSYLSLRDLVFERATGNGLNIDDGGSADTPSHHLMLTNITVNDLPKGNNDGIKLSGVDDFRLERCSVSRWGGSAVDMVGCHRGVIQDCTFKDGGDNAVQTKGGSSDVAIRKCRFENAGQRAVNIGGSTGMPYFRPPVEKMPAGKRYEAKSILVEGCIFVGSVAPIAFVGVDGATVRCNTIYNPERWAIRILQETQAPEFVPCRDGVFTRNIVIFNSARWASGGVNIGPGTMADSFRFSDNFWFCSDRPERGRPTLPTQETGGTYGKDPMLIDPAKGDFRHKTGSSSNGYGAHSLPLK